MLNMEADYANRVVEKQIAEQCAPVILGLKTANLLVVNSYLNVYVCRIFRDTELSLNELCSYESKTYYLLYHPNKLNQYIQQSSISNYLSQLGYSNIKHESVIKTLAYKYNKYMQDRIEFPHEIGILLGYPLTDVLNFISHNGTQYLYSGYWKVYDNLPDALSLFYRYHRAQEILYKFIIHGGTLSTVVNEIIRYE